jgi:hypothetical protein
VGVLRKLAELVVEFPDDQPAHGRSPAKAGSSAADEDPLAAIERVRLELESGMPKKPGDPLKGGTFVPPPSPPLPSADATSVASGIPLPTLLKIEDVYTRAGLDKDPQAMTVDRIEGMLKDPDVADLDLPIRARTVKVTLKNMGHELHEVLLDAARRDQALDSYGQWLQEQTQVVAAQVEAQNAKLKQEIEQFIAEKNGQIDANKDMLAQAREAQAAFTKQQAAEEQRLFDIVAPFVAPGENPVVVGGSAPQKGDMP